MILNSFSTLQDRALDYLSTCIDQVHTFGDILQLVIVELIYKVIYSSLIHQCIKNHTFFPSSKDGQI